MKIPFVKMHGLGNDFVLIDDWIDPARKGQNAGLNQLMSAQICDRRFGVGADQILWLVEPQDASADLRMEILNSDGSRAEMCGNGIRAAALYVQNFLKNDSGVYRVETLGGMKEIQFFSEEKIQVNMETAEFGRGWDPEAQIEVLASDESFSFYEVNMGNPHAVIFVENVESILLETLGPQIEENSIFPNRTNVEFVEVKGPNEIQVRVWERGAGVTLACGTGACASAVAAIRSGKVASPVQVELPGGKLEIQWEGDEEPVFMTGPAVEVFRGYLHLTGSSGWITR